jgi:hypothetical protein
MPFTAAPARQVCDAIQDKKHPARSMAALELSASWREDESHAKARTDFGANAHVCALQRAVKSRRRYNSASEPS